MPATTAGRRSQPTTAHIGNLCCYLSADIARRWLEYFGLRVQQATNITDVGLIEGDDNGRRGQDGGVGAEARPADPISRVSWPS